MPKSTLIRDQLQRAVLVLLLNEQTYAHLAEHDPQALKQAGDAALQAILPLEDLEGHYVIRNGRPRRYTITNLCARADPNHYKGSRAEINFYAKTLAERSLCPHTAFIRELLTARQIP